MEKVSQMEILVRSTEVDVNGHVNNAKYLEYLEWGREDWYEQRGLYYDTLKKLSIVTVVVHVSANYRQEALQNDQLRIRTTLKSVGNTSMTMSQWIFNQHNQRVLDAEFVIVTVRPGLRTKTPVPDLLRAEVCTPEELALAENPALKF